MFVPPGSKLKREILKTYHDNPLSRHRGYFKTYKKIREIFTWKGLKKEVLKYTNECLVCQKNKEEYTHPIGLLQPLPIPNQKWESISMDFIIGLPKIQGKDSIYVVVDHLTKYAHFMAISIEFKAPQLIEVFFKEIFILHGLPKNIVSDRDPKFLRLFWKEIFKLVETKLTPSTSYHPQTDGQIEIVNKWIEGYLRNYVTGQ